MGLGGRVAKTRPYYARVAIPLENGIQNQSYSLRTLDTDSLSGDGQGTGFSSVWLINIRRYGLLIRYFLLIFLADLDRIKGD
jgi:hypothetical protein